MGEKKREEREEKGQRDRRSHLSNLARRMPLASPLQHHEVSVCCGSLHGSQRWSAKSHFPLSLQLRALIPRLFEGELPDATVLQQWLNVLITALFWGVGQAAADAVAMFLDSTGFPVFRDE